MERPNNYKIQIKFDNDKTESFFNGEIEYKGSGNYKDSLIISENLITIVAGRSTKIRLEDILYNHNSSLYTQIIKSLVYYYCIHKKFSKIVSIFISRSRSINILEEKTFAESDLSQIIDMNFNLRFGFSAVKLETIFSESEKSKRLLNSITYLLKANNTEDDYEKFEKLWKSFNPLYKLIGKKPEEFKNLIETRKFVTGNSISFTHSLPKVQSLNVSELRNGLRWREMILNNHNADISGAKSYRDSIIRYSDARVMGVYLETIGNRKESLENAGFYTQVISHINTNIQNETKIDTEVLTVLVLRYMYFVRNKVFHGEKMDSTFRLTRNKDIVEFTRLNDLLEPFIIDLINLNDKY